MKRKICYLLFSILFILTVYGEDKTMEEFRNGLFGIPVTTWVYEDTNYAYNLSFETPDQITFIYYVKETDTEILKINTVRKGIFEIENNILKITFLESQYDVYNTLGEWLKENLTIRMEAEIIETTKLFVRQISGKNIFEKDSENMKLKFNANILGVLL